MFARLKNMKADQIPSAVTDLLAHVSLSAHADKV